MKHSDFTSKYHWLNGLSEYYRFTGQEEKFEPVFKALYHQNYHRKRDILHGLMIKQYEGMDMVPDHLLRSWTNMLLNEHLEDITVKTELITSLISTVADDPFVDRIAKFIDYFTFSNKTDILLPDLGDFLSRGQVKSKLWLVTELAKIVEGSVGNILFYGGWYNFNAHFLLDMFDVSKIYSVDMDTNVVDPCNILYKKEREDNRFEAIASDVKDIRWKDNQAYISQKDWMKYNTSYTGKGNYDLGSINIVINTSCEHMDNTWYNNLPDGTFVILHQNDYFSNPQHSNCCKDLDDVKSKYPMQNIFYEGELDTHLYNRFMLIGIK